MRGDARRGRGGGAAGDRLLFNRSHHEHHGARLRCARKVLGPVLAAMRPCSVLDVGCGLGVWLQAAGEQGVHDVLGLEGEWIDRGLLHIPARCFRVVDLAQPFELGRRFDLCVSLEVAEHLPPASAAGFVTSLVRHADAVLFSAAIPGQGGNGHINEQFQDVWARRFAEHDYVAVDLVRPRVWLDADVFWWLQQNTVLYVHRPRLADYPALSDDGIVEPRMLTVVHPALYIQWLRRCANAAAPHRS